MRFGAVLLWLWAFAGLLVPGSPTLLLTTLFLAVKGGLLAGKISVAGLLLLLLGLLSPIGKRSTDNQRLTRSTRDSILQHITLLDPLKCIQRMVCEISSVNNSTVLGEYEKFVGSLFSPGEGKDAFQTDSSKTEKVKDAIDEEDAEESALEAAFEKSDESSSSSSSSTSSDEEEEEEANDASGETDMKAPGFGDFNDFRSLFKKKRTRRSETKRPNARMMSLGDLVDLIGSKRRCTDPKEGCSMSPDDIEKENLERVKRLESFLLGRDVEDMEDAWRRRRRHLIRNKRKTTPEASFGFRLAAFLGKLTGSRRKCRTFFNSCPFTAEEIASMVRNLHELLRKHPNLGKLAGVSKQATTTPSPSEFRMDNEIVTTESPEMPKRDVYRRSDRP